MEKKKIKFPIATIFFLVYAVVNLILDIYIYSRYETSISIIISGILILLSCIFLSVVLLQKKFNALLLIATVPFVILYGYFLITNFSVYNVIDFLAFLVLAFVVGTVTLPQLSDFNKITAKIFFMPAVLLAIPIMISLIRDLRGLFSGYFNFWGLSNLVDLLLPVAVFLLGLWCMNPYENEQPQTVRADTATVTSTSNAAQPEYDDTYCSLGKHIVLCLFTFGIWYYIWIYRTTRFLNRTPNAEQYNPTNKLLLCMFVPFYSIYWLYKHGQRIDAFSKAKGLNNSDMATLCLILGIFVPIVAVILMQDRINAICTAKPAPMQYAEAEFDPNELPEL